MFNSAFVPNITSTPMNLRSCNHRSETYYNDGIDAVENMWNTLDGYFQYDQLGYAYHYLDVIIELLEKEKLED